MSRLHFIECGVDFGRELAFLNPAELTAAGSAGGLRELMRDCGE